MGDLLEILLYNLLRLNNHTSKPLVLAGLTLIESDTIISRSVHDQLNQCDCPLDCSSTLRVRTVKVLMLRSIKVKPYLLDLVQRPVFRKLKDGGK